MIAIVKSNCYGHGADLLVPEMVSMGVKDFAVACLDEAIELRNMGVKGSILILGYTERNEWQSAYEHNVIMSVVDVNHALAMNKWARQNHMTLKVEVKVDTGMRRIGTDWDCDDKTIKALYGASNLRVNGTFSHLCRADMKGQEDREYTYLQKSRFDQFLAHVKGLGYKTGRTHLCASSGIMNYPEFLSDYDFVRPGFIYFGYDVGEVDHPFPRKPILGWYTRVEMVKQLDEGEGISYGQIYHTDKISKIASLTVGYADGYPRRLSNEGYVLIHGQKARVVGRVCMDQMMVDVSEIEDVECEDIATLIGEDGDNAITLEEFSSSANTMGDEIACLISPRVRRYFVD